METLALASAAVVVLELRRRGFSTSTGARFHRVGEQSASGRQRQLAAAIALVSTLSLGTLASSALLTDTATSPNNAFTTGRVDLAINPTTALFTVPGMAPGDVSVGQIAVSNPGTLTYRYALKSTTDATDANVLAAQLDLTVKVGVTSCTTGGFGSSGTVVYATGDLGSTTGLKLFGDAATGANAGDRTLAAAASENLCFQVSLPLSTANSYAAKTVTAAFQFDAEQTANN